MNFLNEIETIFFINRVFYLFIYKTALFDAVEKENMEIIKLLLAYKRIDVNVLNIIIYKFIKF